MHSEFDNDRCLVFKCHQCNGWCLLTVEKTSNVAKPSRCPYRPVSKEAKWTKIKLNTKKITEGVLSGTTGIITC